MHFRSALTLLLLTSAAAFAQSTGVLAGFSGMVNDASGSAVPNGTVVISTEAQGTLRTVATNRDGLFSAPLWRLRQAIRSTSPLPDSLDMKPAIWICKWAKT